MPSDRPRNGVAAKPRLYRASRAPSKRRRHLDEGMEGLGSGKKKRDRVS
jgi:hypothetical protein